MPIPCPEWAETIFFVSGFFDFLKSGPLALRIRAQPELYKIQVDISPVS